jgi:hypothetical protein
MWNYKVIKTQRGLRGQWFAYPATTFGDEQAARKYAEQFAADQRAAGVVGTRIVVVSRARVRNEFGRLSNLVAEYRV